MFLGKPLRWLLLEKVKCLSMMPKGERMVCEFVIVPSRGIIGSKRNQLLTATAGEAIMNHRFKEFATVQRRDTRAH